jgi:hypothetical protein
MKTRFLFQTVTICSLFLSCAEAPEYTPKPQQPVATTGSNQGATKTPATSDAQKTATNKDAATMTPNTPAAAPTPTPTPTPTPGATPANPSLGVAATGKTLLMQSCAASCHVLGGMPGTPIDARNSAMLLAGVTFSPQHSIINQTVPIFTAPAAGAPANAHSHVVAYFGSLQAGAIVRGPTLP